MGSQFRVTRSRGFWLRTLDGRPASETYAQLFGYPARDWAFPPLSHLARLYPLGIEQGDQLVVRAPIRVEADGSFRMNAPVRDGADAYLLVGSWVSCESAAQQAAQQALQQLEGRKPVFALILVDIAWEMLLKSHPGSEISAVQDILGEEVPIAGGIHVRTNRPRRKNQIFHNCSINTLLLLHLPKHELLEPPSLAAFLCLVQECHLACVRDVQLLLQTGNQIPSLDTCAALRKRYNNDE